MRLQQLFFSLSSKGNGNLQNQTGYTWYTKRESSAKFTSTLKRTLEIPHLFRWKYLADNWNHSGNIIHGLCHLVFQRCSEIFLIASLIASLKSFYIRTSPNFNIFFFSWRTDRTCCIEKEVSIERAKWLIIW